MTEHSQDTITAALLALALVDGDATKAAEKIEVEGVTPAVLKGWKTKEYRTQYDDIAKRLGQEREAQIVATSRRIAEDASSLEIELIQKVRSQLGNMDGREAAQAARAIADVKAKNVDKFLALTGRDPGDKPEDDVLSLLAAAGKKGWLTLNVPDVVPGVARVPNGALGDGHE